MKKIALSPRTSLTYVGTDKFKTSCISVNLITPLRRETAAANALIPQVLRRGSAEHPDMDAISKALDELYGARVEYFLRKKGEYQCIGFYADFIDDDFVPSGSGERILERTAALLGEILLSPRTHGGILFDEYVNSERANLIDEIRAGINDKRAYSRDALLKNMCADEAFGVNVLGTENEAKAITAKSLTAQYRRLLDSSRVEAFYCGSAEARRVELALGDALAGLPRSIAPRLPETKILLTPPAPEPRRFVEQLDVTQGKLVLGFRLGDTMLTPDYAAMSVFDAAFGGSVSSKLFLNVREKLSLCYYASSSIEKHKGVMLVSSGVEFTNFTRAHDEILSQLDAIKHGDLSDWELLSAKRAVVTNRLSALDSPSGIEGACFDQTIAGIEYTPEQFAALAETVSRDAVIEIANNVILDSVYLMEGLGDSQAIKEGANEK
ncbi:MAG: insulinase family protein [Oscillospiraceae bacterium]|jgi:predicted Zn-dependent peptidase|nr:insulinase family protein [Oscillospiraceae bacterium]